MYQELISTSLPKNLSGNLGFGIVAQTAGMAPNVVNAVNALSGYQHLAEAGSAKNPPVFLHTVRTINAVRQHIISRITDAGNDYSGRTNRFAHHWVIEEPADTAKLSCGPAPLFDVPNLFRTSYNEKPQELPRGTQIPNQPVAVKECIAWKQAAGDAGWAGIVAENIEKGNPVSLLFAPGLSMLPLLQEVFALLPAIVRWKTTFSTFYMKAQETATDKIQVKCFVKGTPETALAKMTPNTLLLDLTQPQGTAPAGKYVEAARTGQAVVQPHDRGLTPTPFIPAQQTQSKRELPDGVTPDTFSAAAPAHRQLQYGYSSPKQRYPQPFWMYLCLLSLAANVLLGALVGINMLNNQPAVKQEMAVKEPVGKAKPAEQGEPKTTETKKQLKESEQESPELATLTAEEPIQNAATKAINDAMSEVDTLLTKDENKVIVGDKASEIKGEAKKTAEKAIKDKKPEDMNQLAKDAATQSIKAWIAREKDRQTAEDANKLNKLPDVWNIPLLTEEKEPTLLPDLAWLDNKKDVKLEYVPFVKNKKFASTPSGKSVSITLEEKEIAKIEITKEGLKLGKGKDIAKIEITKEGLKLGKGKDIETEIKGGNKDDLLLFNLAILKITLGKNIKTKTIALWNPKGVEIEKNEKGIILTKKISEEDKNLSITLPDTQEFVVIDNKEEHTGLIDSINEKPQMITSGDSTSGDKSIVLKDSNKRIKFTKISIKDEKEGKLVLVDNEKNEENK
ncbi:hypothetical protein FACS189419_03220 [Planctomycetales bacterium]|nr:hypothetical protein FACS189419_03220 [Planctomycetales bacterium]